MTARARATVVRPGTPTRGDRRGPTRTGSPGPWEPPSRAGPPQTRRTARPSRDAPRTSGTETPPVGSLAHGSTRAPGVTRRRSVGTDGSRSQGLGERPRRGRPEPGWVDGSGARRRAPGMHTDPRPRSAWPDRPWRSVERAVCTRHQRRARARRRGDVQTVRTLPRRVMTSWEATRFATRRVPQDPRGQNTAGVDGVTSRTPPNGGLVPPRGPGPARPHRDAGGGCPHPAPRHHALEAAPACTTARPTRWPPSRGNPHGRRHVRRTGMAADPDAQATRPSTPSLPAAPTSAGPGLDPGTRTSWRPPSHQAAIAATSRRASLSGPPVPR